MNRIATMTVIRGTGDCQILMNDVIQREIEKLNAAHNKELDDLKFRLDTLTKQKCTLQENIIKSINEMVEDEPVGFIDKVKESIEYIWCMMWGMALAYGLIVEIKEKEEVSMNTSGCNARTEKSM